MGISNKSRSWVEGEGFRRDQPATTDGGSVEIIKTMFQTKTQWNGAMTASGGIR